MGSHGIRFSPRCQDFVADVTGVDFTKPVPDDVCDEIKAALHKYGVLVFRETGLGDESQVEFARNFGPLDSMKMPKAAGVKMRIEVPELTDQSNLEADGSVIDPDTLRGRINKSNLLFHVDNSYNSQRASYSILRAAEVPAAAVGGNTEFVDSRRAWAELPDGWKQELLDRDYEVWHSFWHSRKIKSPEFFDRIDPAQYPMARRKLVERVGPGGGGTLSLCIPSHCHHIEGMDPDESRSKLDFLYRHATQDRYVVSVAWLGPGDTIMWDNRIVLHRGTPMTGAFKRDLRRATVLDEGPGAYSLNEIPPDASWKALFDVARQYQAV